MYTNTTVHTGLTISNNACHKFLHATVWDKLILQNQLYVFHHAPAYSLQIFHALHMELKYVDSYF